MIQFTKEYSGIVFDVDIQDRISLFTGYSGTGKTFAFGAIQEYFVSNNIRTIYFDDRQMDYTADQLISLCDNKEVILLDNADLYLTQNLGSLRNVGVVKSICKQKQTAAYQSSNHGISATGGFTSHGYSCRNRVSFVN